MKFTEHLGAHLTPEWRSQYIEYEQLKEVLYNGLDKMPRKDESPESVVQSYISTFEEQWFHYCDEELEKINMFFAEKIAEASRKFTALKNELHLCGSMKVGPSLNSIATSTKVTLSPKPSKTATVKKKKKISEMKFAFGEFYLSLVLLQNYQQLNFTGFRKILKKHDKLFETPSGAQYRQAKVEVAAFFTNKHVDELILETEDLYISELEGGNRSKAMNRLRVPPLAEELRHGKWVTCRVGFLAGIFVMLVAVATVTAFFTDHPGEFDIAIRVYRGVFLFVLVTFLLAVNTWGWRQAGVNHVLIFELDPREHLSYQHLLEVALLLGVLWASSLVLFMFGHVLRIEAYLPNLVLVSFLFLFTINPFRIWYYRARFWLLKILFRIFTAPFTHVGFADFWMADQLNSLVVALLDFQYIVCFYAHDWHVDAHEMICDGTLYGIRPVVACLPAWFRFAQCLRRYRDTSQAFPHLVNAGKYSTSFFVVAFSTLAKSDSVQRDRFFMLWIIAAILSTCYTFTWDIKMDWGLFDKNAGENKFLREETVYRSKAFYYFAIIEDLVFRLLWTLTVSVGELEIFHSELLKLILSVCEVFRRFIWNFFRLENEHLNNCGQFRAVRDISVVPMDTHDQVYLEHMMDDVDGLERGERGGRRKRKSSVIVKSLRKISSKTDGVVIRKSSVVVLQDETETTL